MHRALALTLPLSLLVILWSAVADAEAVRDPRTRQPVVVRPGPEVVPPGWYRFPGRKPIPPEENRNLDPSNRGSG